MDMYIDVHVYYHMYMNIHVYDFTMVWIYFAFSLQSAPAALQSCEVRVCMILCTYIFVYMYAFIHI